MSPEGADSSCGIYMLIETAKQNWIEPIKYLNELFEKCLTPSVLKTGKNSCPGIFLIRKIVDLTCFLS